MALGFTYSSGEGGDFLDIVKFDSRAGRVFRVDRGSDGAKESVDITKKFKAVFDMENIEVGFIDFPAGAAPDFQLVPLGAPFPAKRNPKAKQGLRVVMKLSNELGGSIREVSSVANVFKQGFEKLHDSYEASKAANPGKLPVVTVEDFIPITAGTGDKKSTNYQPIFVISGWAPRPADLVASPRGGSLGAGADAAVAEAVKRAAPPATGGTRVEAPTTHRTPEPANAEEDFG